MERFTSAPSRVQYWKYQVSPGWLLPLTEAREAFANYDGSDGSAPDGEVNEGEFTCAMEERLRAVPGDDSRMVQRVMDDAQPWSTLLTGIDKDGSESLSAPELDAFYSDRLRTDTIDYSDWGSGGATRRAQRKYGQIDLMARQVRAFQSHIVVVGNTVSVTVFPSRAIGVNTLVPPRQFREFHSSSTIPTALN